MENKLINSHFIQKAHVKKWADDSGNVNYLIHGTKGGGVFNIESRAKTHPIAEFGFYDEEIEKGMNLLEYHGNQVVNKIVSSHDNVIITRKESVILRCYFLLNTTRTKLARENIGNLNGDKSYNAMMKRENGTPKEIQQKELKILVESFDRYISTGNGTFPISETDESMILERIKNNVPFEKIINEISENNNVEKRMKSEINHMPHSRLIFVKFNEGELFLTESSSFQEITKLNAPRAMYNCFILSPNRAVVILEEPLHSQFLELKIEPSVIFNFDLNKRNTARYIKKLDMKKAFEDFARENKELSFVQMNQKFSLEVKSKFHTLEDQFEYEWNIAGEDEAFLCNAMMLVHCNDSYVIFKNINSYFKSLEMQRLKGIYRIEDEEKW